MTKDTIRVVLWLALVSTVTAQEPFEIPIWPGVAPGSPDGTKEEEWVNREITDGTDTLLDRAVKGVTKPTVTIYLPSKDRATGAAVLICPGGGFSHLAIDKEGYDVADWLRSHGIAGIVLKYRLPDPGIQLYLRNTSVPDLQRAIRLVRHNAVKWNIDPGRIGVMGFSAGGYLAAVAGTLFDDRDPGADDPISRLSSRPDFVVLVYPVVSLDIQSRRGETFLKRMLGPDPAETLVLRYSPDKQVSEGSPPTFLVHAHDDRLTSEHSIRFYLALKEAGVPAELHVYSKGGHGFGTRQRGWPVSAWRDRLLSWMEAEGLVH